jgi:hypothetical protein
MTTDDVATSTPNDPATPDVTPTPVTPPLDPGQERKLNKLEAQLETAMEKWEGKKKNPSKIEAVLDGLLMELSNIPYFGSIPRIVRDERAKGHEAVILALYHHARALILEARNDSSLSLDDVNKIIEAIKKSS